MAVLLSALLGQAPLCYPSLLPDAISPSFMSTNTNAPEAQLSFLGCVNIAVNLAAKQYPTTTLAEVETHVTNPGSPSPIEDLRVVFQADGGLARVFAEMTHWGEFAPLVFQRKGWHEDAVIPWPIEMDIVEADQLLKEAGYTGPYGAVTLRHPVAPGVVEPYYIFTLMTGEYIFVGIIDKKVTKSDLKTAITGHEAA